MTPRRWFYHPDKRHLQPIETTRPTEGEVEGLLRDGWRECGLLGYQLWMKRWRENREGEAA